MTALPRTRPRAPQPVPTFFYTDYGTDADWRGASGMVDGARERSGESEAETDEEQEPAQEEELEESARLYTLRNTFGILLAAAIRSKHIESATDHVVGQAQQKALQLGLRKWLQLIMK